MNRKWITPILAGFVLVFGVVGVGDVCAQVFPYAAPRAPEFDANGDPIVQQSGNDPAPQSAPTTQRAPAQESPVTPAVAPTTSGVPMAPEVIPRRPPSRKKRARRRRAESQPVASRRPPAPPQEYPQPYGPPPAATANPGQAPVQGNAVPDCSNYPMMLARAGNKREMQSIARHFLTCLLKSGWTMESARKHVISTIETVKAMRF